MGLSIAGAQGFKFVPEWLMDFCKRSKISVGNLANDIFEAVEDLLQRAYKAVELRSFAPLFESKFKDAPLLEAMEILAVEPRDLQADAGSAGS